MRTCLVVDDSSVIRKVARRILEGLDFQIVEAEDGEKALEVCKRSLPDAILLDWNMPVMDGYEFLGNLRRMPGGSTALGVSVCRLSHLVKYECCVGEFLHPDFQSAGAVAGDGGRRFRRHPRPDLAL